MTPIVPLALMLVYGMALGATLLRLWQLAPPTPLPGYTNALTMRRNEGLWRWIRYLSGHHPLTTFHKSRRSRSSTFHSRYSVIGNDKCLYCGEEAECNDHFLPLCQMAAKTEAENTYQTSYLVPSCNSCNMIASDELFDTIMQKKNYIKSKLIDKYVSILSIPKWEEEEIRALGWSMKRHVKAGTGQQRRLQQRIAFLSISNNTDALIAETSSTAQETGPGSAHLHADSDLRIGSEKRQPNYTIACKCCGKVFVSNWPMSKYCREACRNIHARRRQADASLARRWTEDA